ncbi:Thioesterase-like protein TwmA [Exophiala dermatitidis]
MATTFADVLPVKQTSSHQYTTDLETEWCIGTVPNGGYITSAFLVVARTHMSLTHRTRSEPHPINLHLEFLRRTSVGTARFTVRDVKLGARISNLHITLSQLQHPDEPSGPHNQWQDEVEGYITMSNLGTESGLSLDTEYKPYPPVLPVDLDSLRSHGQDPNYTLRAKDPFSQFRRAAQNIQMFLVKPDRKPADRPKSINDQWVRFAPGGASESSSGKLPSGRWTNDALGFVVDIFPQIVESYVNPYAEEAALGQHSESELKQYLKSTEKRAKYWYPTLVLNLDVKKLLPPKGVEWLFVRVKAKAIRNGRFDLDVEVWDETNELVATSHHASLVVDSARNTTRKGKTTKL